MIATEDPMAAGVQWKATGRDLAARCQPYLFLSYGSRCGQDLSTLGRVVMRTLQELGFMTFVMASFFSHIAMLSVIR